MLHGVGCSGASGQCPTKPVILHSSQTLKTKSMLWQKILSRVPRVWVHMQITYVFICVLWVWGRGWQRGGEGCRGGLYVCAVSASTQGVSSMSERQRQIDRVRVRRYKRHESSAICEGMTMILSNNPPNLVLKSMSPIFSPRQDSKDTNSAVRLSDKDSFIHPTPFWNAPDNKAFTWQGNCAGGWR